MPFADNNAFAAGLARKATNALADSGDAALLSGAAAQTRRLCNSGSSDPIRRGFQCRPNGTPSEKSPGPAGFVWLLLFRRLAHGQQVGEVIWMPRGAARNRGRRCNADAHARQAHSRQRSDTQLRWRPGRTCRRAHCRLNNRSRSHRVKSSLRRMACTRPPATPIAKSCSDAQAPRQMVRQPGA